MLNRSKIGVMWVEPRPDLQFGNVKHIIFLKYCFVKVTSQSYRDRLEQRSTWLLYLIEQKITVKISKESESCSKVT